MNADSDLVARAVRADGLARQRVRWLRDRVTTPDARPPGDWQTRMVSTILDDLVGGLVDRFRAHLLATAEALTVASFAVPLATADPGLLAIALARAEEHRLQALLEKAPADRLSGQVADPALAPLELALLVSESRRRDRVGEPRLSDRDLDADTMHALVWRVAAAARARLIADGIRPATVDRAVAAASAALLADHDEGEGAAVAAMRLARQMDADDGTLLSALAAGRLTLAAALLSLRTGLPHRTVADALHDAERLALVMRAAGVARETLAAALLLLAPAYGLDDDGLVALVDACVAVDEAVADDALSLLRHDGAYARAVAEARPS